MIKYSLQVKVYGTNRNPGYAEILKTIMNLPEWTLSFTAHDIEPNLIMTKYWQKKEVE